MSKQSKHYETMFIVKPTLVEEEIKQKIDFYKDAITKNGGKIETCLDMGMRNLAYDIKKHKRGYYFVIYFLAQPSAILELERLYRISEDILRFIVIKYESKKEQKAWQTLVDRANKKVEPIKLSAPRARSEERGEKGERGEKSERSYDKGDKNAEQSAESHSDFKSDFKEAESKELDFKESKSKITESNSDSADS